MKKIKLSIFTAIAALVFVQSGFSETLKSLDYHGRWPDASQRAAAIDNDRGLLFVADGNVLSVLKATDLAVVSKLSIPLATGFQAIVLNSAGTHVYAACGQDGLQIIDVTDETRPFITGLLKEASVDDPIFASGIAFLTNRAYVADVYYGLRIINVADPANPFQELSYEQVSVSSEGTIFSGGYENLAVEKINTTVYAFVLDKYRGVRILENTGSDVVLSANYPATEKISSLYSTKPLTDIAVIDQRYGIIADYENGLVFVDLFSDTKNPEAISVQTLVNFSTPGSASSISAGENYLYVADGNSGMTVVDISDPLQPEITGSFETDGAHSVLAAGKTVFLSDSRKGLQQIDASNPAVPVATGFYDTPSDADALFVQDTTIYTVDDDPAAEGLRIISFSKNEVYELIGFCPTPGTAKDVYVDKKTAFVADGAAGMTVINAGSPKQPEVMTSSTAAGGITNAVHIHVAGGYAYLTDAGAGIFVFNIADPASPSLAGRFNPGKGINGFYARADKGFAVYDGGMDVIDISNPADLFITGSLITNGDGAAVAADASYAYLADGAAGFSLISLSRPERPAIIETYPTSGVCEAVDVYSVFAHCAAGEAGVEVLGVVDVTPPRLSFVSTTDTPGYAADISVSGGDAARFTYVADSSGGLLAFEHNDQFSGGIDEQPFTESTHNRGWDRHEGGCFISSCY